MSLLLDSLPCSSCWICLTRSSNPTGNTSILSSSGFFFSCKQCQGPSIEPLTDKGRSNSSILFSSAVHVSIPFKRESVFRVYRFIKTGHASSVSIPFKRESVFREETVQQETTPVTMVSIPFKRESVFRAVPPASHLITAIAFQFPSNGKVYSEANQATALADIQSSFNSLQTGKCIQSEVRHMRCLDEAGQFQFPSNGKVDSERLSKMVGSSGGVRNR